MEYCTGNPRKIVQKRNNVNNKNCVQKILGPHESASQSTSPAHNR